MSTPLDSTAMNAVSNASASSNASVRTSVGGIAAKHHAADGLKPKRNAGNGDSGSNAASNSNSGSSSSNGGVHKVGLLGLVAIVLSAMIGGGVFDLPQNMSESASAGGQIIAWVITGFGMWFIANMFRILADVRPKLNNGLYSYAYHGFGRFAGFLSAYGYWISNCFSTVAYGILIMSTLEFFFPGKFGEGNNWLSIILCTVILWFVYFLTLRGVRGNAVLNIVGTFCKLIPPLIFVVALFFAFHWETFVHGFWGLTQSGASMPFNFGGVMKQVSGTMLVTLWIFIGIEGAVVVSGDAKKQSDVAKATTIGFFSILVLYMLVSLLPLGVYSYRQVAAMDTPSMAVIMQDQLGPVGAVIVNLGIIIAVFFAWFVWMLMLSQMPLYAARDGNFPQQFAATNSKDAPTYSLLVSTIVCQVLFIFGHFLSGNAWNTLIKITSILALPCYLLCCMFLWKIAARHEWPENARFSKRNALVTGIIGTLFSLYLVYSAGLQYLMVACLVYALGIPIFIVGRRQHEGSGILSVFGRRSRIIAICTIIAGLIGLIYLIVEFCM